MSGAIARGTTPEGAGSEQEAAQFVRGMFGRIARRYDLANHLLSGNLDPWWRAQTVRRVRHVLQRDGARVLDICCGTGDLTLALERGAKPAALIMGSDFCHPMLVSARGKVARRKARAPLFESDALRLPVRDGTLDLLTVAFGFRNLTNYRAGLEEIRRVLKPGGMCAILEFSQPRNRAFGALYNLYSRWILPVIGRLVTGESGAYRYLPESVRKFPSAIELAEEMLAAGFDGVRFELFTGGIVALHLGSVSG